jgi:predicted short-subunit dehydrogenase-like oxidoreductase (DUF2520 family)
MDLQRISFAGAGRVGGALCREFFHAGFTIDKVVTETAFNGRTLAGLYNASWSSDLIFPDSTDVIIVAVPDHRLKEVLEQIRCHPDTLITHTAGSFGLEIFPDKLKRKGIIYPLQTFSDGRDLNFKEIPFLLEASDNQASRCIQALVDSIGGKGYFVDLERRRILHLAAVFICNFTNHMLTQGKEIAGRAGFSLEIFEPLINETISKAIVLGPENVQTGPAVRNDKNTIEKQLELLSFSPEMGAMYKAITDSIIKYYKKH